MNAVRAAGASGLDDFPGLIDGDAAYEADLAGVKNTLASRSDAMMTSTSIKPLTILTGLVISGEALALAVGMHVLSPSGNPWISLKNDLFLALDVLTGLGLVVLMVANKRVVASGILYALVFLSFIAHAYREWGYLARAGNAVCANVPLFVVNNLKLIGLLVVAVGVVGMRFTPRS
jgi:hypothetical protein